MICSYLLSPADAEPTVKALSKLYGTELGTIFAVEGIVKVQAITAKRVGRQRFDSDSSIRGRSRYQSEQIHCLRTVLQSQATYRGARGLRPRGSKSMTRLL
jgi:hypothetical protein